MSANRLGLSCSFEHVCAYVLFKSSCHACYQPEVSQHFSLSAAVACKSSCNRHTKAHHLHTRTLPTHRTDKCVIASAGCQVDMKALQKLLQARNVMFQHNHGKPMSCKGAAQLLSNTLYYKRFFPYYTFNLCAGLDEEGELRVGAATPKHMPYEQEPLRSARARLQGMQGRWWNISSLYVSVSV